VPLIPDLAGLRVGESPNMNIELGASRQVQRVLQAIVVSMYLLSVGYGETLTLMGKNNGNQLIMSGLIICIRSGWILKPTVP